MADYKIFLLFQITLTGVCVGLSQQNLSVVLDPGTGKSNLLKTGM